MADPFVAEIRMFPFNFAPRGWAWCDGQLLPLSQNTALFSLLGTTYGGDGKSNFALPNLQGRSPMQPGQGPGLSQRDLGEAGGSETVTLTQAHIPQHTHALRAAGSATQSSPANNAPGQSAASRIYGPPTNLVAMADAAIAPAGAAPTQPHNNLQPYLTVCFCIALQGVYPPRP